MSPTVSLITVFHNRDRYLSATISSILAQTYRDFELLLWDDGSTDQSLVIARHYAQQDPRVRAMVGAHQGFAASLKAAIAQTQGQYLAWIDSDDLLAPEALAETVAVLAQSPSVGMVYTDYQVINAQTQVTGYGGRCRVPYSPGALLEKFMTFHFRLLRRSVYEQVGGVDPRYNTAEDYELCLRLSEVTAIHHLPRPLYYYRCHGESTSNQRRNHQEEQCILAREAALQRWRSRSLAVTGPRQRRPLVTAGTGLMLVGLPLLGSQPTVAAPPAFQLAPSAPRETQMIPRFQLSDPALPGNMARPETLPGSPEPLLVAQAVAPAVDGTNTQVNQVNNQFDITGGQLSRDGANLFHSFSRFGLDANQVANFLAVPQIRNILGRVAAGEASVIDGVLRVSGSNANLFLMNPSGIVFGPNARLDLPGSFTATTANAIGFGDQWFSSVGSNPYANLTGTPSSLAFSLAQPGGILNAGNLTLQPGRSLNLLGGTVINIGQINAPGGLVIATVPGSSVVRISQAGSPLTIEMQAPGTLPTPAPAASLADLAANQTGLTNDNGTVRTSSGLAIQPGDVALVGSQSRLVGNTIQIEARATLRLTDSQLHAQEDAFLNSQDRVQIRDSETQPVLVTAGRHLTIQGNQGIDILALNHPTTPFQSGGDLSLVSNGVISGDAHFWSGGNFSLRTLSGGTGQFVSLYDPIIRSTGDVTFGSYTGVALKVEAGGNITVNGDIQITGPDVTIPTSDPDATLLTTTPALILRAGTAVAAPEVIGTPPGGLVTTPAPTTPGNITVNGNIDTSNFDVLGGEFPIARIGGPVILDAQGNITTGNINASANASETFLPATGGRVDLLARTGNIQTGTIDTSAVGEQRTATSGNIRLQALNGLITVADIDTSASNFSSFSNSQAQAGTVEAEAGSGLVAQDIFTDAFANSSIYGVEAQGGRVALSVQNGSLQVGRVFTSASTSTSSSSATATSQAGNVTLETPTVGNNIVFTSIDAAAFADNAGEGPANARGGNVQVLAQGTVRGTDVGLNEEFTIDAQANANGSVTTITGGTVTLQHDGGPTNVPFVIGNAAVNGLSDGIRTGNDATPTLLTSGSFPVLPNGGDATGTPAGITIRSINTPPAIAAITALPPTLVDQPIAFTFADLATTITDLNLDVTQIQIAAIAPGATLRVNGVAVTVGTVIGPGDNFEYVPPPGLAGEFTAFSLQASDGVSLSTPAPINLLTQTQPAPPVIEEPRPPEPRFPEPPQADPRPSLPPGTPFTTVKTLDEAQQILQNIERETGVRPALIYIRFIPTRFGAGLNFTSQEAAFSEAYTAYLKEPNLPGGGLSVETRDDDGVEILVVTAKGEPVRIRLRGLSRKDLVAVTQEFRSEVSDRRKTRTVSYQQSARQLYQWLIAPILPTLQAREINNLVFVMDEQLRSLPVAALQNPQDEFLVEQYSIGLMPSLSLTDTRYVDVRQTKVLAMGTAEFANQRHLPAVPLELQTIQQLWNASVLPDERFTLSNLKSSRQQQPFGIVHLATHGEFRPKDPSNSYVQLGDTKLQLDQLRQLGLNNPPAQLLVLSACRTALGDRDAELGFAGMAIKAGSKSALGSLWYVSDIGTLALMGKFYDSLRQVPIKSEALRQAQLALLKGEVSVSDRQLIGLGNTPLDLPANLQEQEITDLRHPFFWSPFTMVGNPW